MIRRIDFEFHSWISVVAYDGRGGQGAGGCGSASTRQRVPHIRWQRMGMDMQSRQFVVNHTVPPFSLPLHRGPRRSSALHILAFSSPPPARGKSVWTLVKMPLPPILPCSITCLYSKRRTSENADRGEKKPGEVDDARYPDPQTPSQGCCAG
jgi:hypothetical protein